MQQRFFHEQRYVFSFFSPRLYRTFLVYVSVCSILVLDLVFRKESVALRLAGDAGFPSAFHNKGPSIAIVLFHNLRPNDHAATSSRLTGFESAR